LSPHQKRERDWLIKIENGEKPREKGTRETADEKRNKRKRERQVKKGTSNLLAHLTRSLRLNTIKNWHYTTAKTTTNKTPTEKENEVSIPRGKYRPPKLPHRIYSRQLTKSATMSLVHFKKKFNHKGQISREFTNSVASNK
jgi:hypothetical protein